VRTPLWVFIIAFNEAHRIGKTIAAIRDLADEVVVIDSGSTDGTQAIARNLGARVIHRDWQGYGHQKGYAEKQCKYDWLFNLDADEVVTQELKSEIGGLFDGGIPLPPGAYSIRICEVLPGENASRPFAYAHRYVRLYHRSAGSYRPSTVHDVVQVNRAFKVKRLKGKVDHHSAVTVSTQIAKFNNYTDALVEDMQRRHVVRPVWRLFVEFPVAFFKAYVMRRYFLRGIRGHTSAMSYAFFRYLRLAKHVEARREHDLEEGRPDFCSPDCCNARGTHER
jgi:glycosyltransferase involved in cell wall biosynthesis